MQFILIAQDKTDSLALRVATRPAHLAYWRDEVGAALLYGGPILGQDGNPAGSMLVVTAESEDAARAIFQADPYVAAGLFLTAQVSGFRTVFTNGQILA